MLKNAQYYYNIACKEYQENGDTNKRRDYIRKMIEFLNMYKVNGGKHLDNENYLVMKYLEEEYYEELIFAPTIEDLKEMKYWI